MRFKQCHDCYILFKTPLKGPKYCDGCRKKRFEEGYKKQRRCLRCGFTNKMASRYKNAVYCKPCKAIVTKEKAREYYYNVVKVRNNDKKT